MCRATGIDRNEADVDVRLHPERERLVAYHDGKLPGGEADEVASHLAACPRCREAVGSLPDEDPLVVLLRSLPAEMRPTCRREGVLGGLQDHPRYEIMEEVGSGGMGVVYTARHRLLDRVVAVKLIRNPASQAAAGRFIREARATARLDHPNVVRVHEAEEHAGQLLLVMEYVEGADLGRLVRERGPLPVVQACGYVGQAALGLQHAHERGLAHHDVKPSNLIVTPRGVVKVVDFGLASLVGQGQQAAAAPGDETPATGSLTAIRGRGMGTPDYVAPEQAADASAADIRSDIYSLGATLYHMLAGRPPFDEGDAGRRVLGHLLLTPTPIRELRPDVPAALARVLDAMMSKNPAARPQTPAEVAEALAPFAERSPPGRRRFLAAAGVVLAGGVAATAWWATRPRHARELLRLAGHGGPVQALALSPDGGLVLSGCDDRRLRLFDVATGGLVREVEAHDDWVVCVAWLPDGRHALSGSTDGTLKLWDIRIGKLVRRFPDHEATVLCVAVTPDGKLALTGTDSRLVRLWELGSGRLLHRMSGHLGPVQCVAVSDDGRACFTGGNDRVVRVWDLGPGREAGRLEGHQHVVTCILPLPGGRVLTACIDRTTRLWDVAAGQQLDVQGYPLPPVRLFARGSRLLAACKDDQGGCRLHDAAGEEVCRFAAHRDAVWGFAMTGDGRRAVTADRAGVVVLWDMPADVGATP